MTFIVQVSQAPFNTVRANYVTVKISNFLCFQFPVIFLSLEGTFQDFFDIEAFRIIKMNLWKADHFGPAVAPE